MKPAPFDYYRAGTPKEAVTLLARHGADAKILAGGQSLVPMLALRLARPGVVVDINRIPGLDGLHVANGQQLRLGALVRQRTLERWAVDRAPLVAAVLRMVGHVAIRTRGTVAGSVSHADPASELPALLLALDGVAIARRQGGQREIAAPDLFLGPLTTALAGDEIVVETRWSLPAPTDGWGFHEVARRHGDFALAGAIAIVTVAGGRIDRARLALFGAGSTPVRALVAEKALVGAVPHAAAVAEAARAAADAVDPVADIHASAQYRRRVARALADRALTDALARAAAGR